MQIINVKLISMNCENVCGYLCFCCADAVDCGAEEELTWMFMDWWFVLDEGTGWCGLGCVPGPVDTALKPV